MPIRGPIPTPIDILAPPEPIETVALLPDHPPVSFFWRGSRRRVRRADGPERLFSEWWKRDSELIAVRDYFQVQDDAVRQSYSRVAAPIASVASLTCFQSSPSPCNSRHAS